MLLGKKFSRWLVISLAFAGCICIFSSMTMASKVKLVWAYPGWDTKEQEAAVTAVVKEFMRLEPNIEVEIRNYPWSVMHDKLVVELRAKQGPDVGYVNSRWTQEFIQNGFLMDLTSRLSQINRDDWMSNYWSSVSRNNKVYALPDRREAYVMFYNKALFRDAGIKSVPETMDDFLVAAKALTTKGVYGFGLVGASHPTMIGQFTNFLYAFGGRILNADGTKATINDEHGVNALSFYADLYHKFKVCQTSAPGDARDQVRQLFMAGRVGMMIDGLFGGSTFTSMAPQLEWGIFKIPQVKGEKRSAVAGGWDNAIFSYTKNPEEAWKFVKFITEPENMAKMTMTFPVRKSAFEMPRFKDPSNAPWLDALQNSDPELSSPYYEQIALILGDAVQDVLVKNVSAKKAMDAAAARIDELIAK